MSTESRDAEVEGLLVELDEPCDHKRLSCEEISCQAPRDRRIATALRALLAERDALRVRLDAIRDAYEAATGKPYWEGERTP